MLTSDINLWVENAITFKGIYCHSTTYKEQRLLQRIKPRNCNKVKHQYYGEAMKSQGHLELDECYFIAAQIVQQYGEKYLPIFKRLHREREKLNSDYEFLKLALRSNAPIGDLGKNIKDNAKIHWKND